MIVKKETPALFLRVSNYGNYDFIKEHKKILDEKGYVWFLKMGRMMNQKIITEIIEKGGLLIMKSPVKSGSHFYLCKLVENKVPVNKNEIVYPKYYNEIFEYENYQFEDFLHDGYWYKITSMEEISGQELYNFIFYKNKRMVTPKAIYSRVVNFYLESKKDFELKTFD